jgi:acetoin utilization protein AcuB
MSHPVITIGPGASLEDAARIMASERIGRLPVVDRSGKLIGIITEKQILRFSPSEATTLDTWEIKGAMSKIQVEKAMTRQVISIAPDEPIEEAARVMVDHEISGIPVVEGGALVGIIAETDLFKTFLEVLGAREPGIRLTVLVPKAPGQLAKISQAIFAAGGNIISLGTFYGQSSDTAEITLKVDGVPQERLMKVVQPHVTSILDARPLGIV